MSIYDDIQAERDRQDAQWGGPSHDDEHSAFEWREYRAKQEERFITLVESQPPAVYNPVTARLCLVKIAALAVAQIEAMDRC